MRNSNAEIQNRRHQIVNLLRQYDRLATSEISKMLSVSEVTVRRDLDTLAANNMIERFHGAACLKQSVSQETLSFLDKRETHQKEKEQIAKKAAEQIESGDIVFVNSGSTVLFLPKFIHEPHVKIVTNNACMSTAEGTENVSLIITGGERYERTQSLVGDVALYALSRIHANKCILSVNGISADYGITTAFYMEVPINESMLQHCSGKRIVIADSSKIGRSFSFVSASINAIDTLITDRNADPREVEKLTRAGVNVLFADAPGEF